MIITVLLIIYCIMLISALLYLAANLYTKHDRQRRITAREKYQEHIDSMVEELFPPSPQDTQYQEAKRKMIADIRTYFNQRKNDAAIAKIPGPDEHDPVNQSARSYEELTFPTPPSIELMD